MLIIGSVSLNLSTCYENATCGTLREEGQESTPWLRDGHHDWQEQQPTERLQGAPEQEKPRGVRQQDELCPTRNRSLHFPTLLCH